jgi:DNA modification methylase
VDVRAIIKRETKIIDIGLEKTCDCSPKHINCLSAKEWIKAQIGVWEFFYEKRDIRDKTIHPAVFPISLAKHVISLFTHQGELVVDPFVGAGTTLLAAQELDRNAVGFDLYQKYIEICKERLSQSRLPGISAKRIEADEQQNKTAEQQQLITVQPIEPSSNAIQFQTALTSLNRGTSQHLAILDDARNVSQYFSEETVSLIWTSPPYANLLNRPRLNKSRRGDTRKNNGQYLKVEQYGSDSRDLGLLSAEGYQEEMGAIFANMLPIMKPKGHVVINIPDMWSSDVKGGRRIPLHIHIYNALTDVGYELRNTIIWNRNNLVNKVGIFGWPSNYITMGTTFEYILDFWKPP